LERTLIVEHWLHFIGKGLYKRAVFEHEANRLGVQRAIPFRSLRSFDFGTPILLGYHIRSQDRRYKDRRRISKGTGEIIGYFNVESLVHSLSKEILEDLYVLLDCDCMSIDAQTGGESRACGSYSIVAICHCRNNWDEIINRIEQTCKKHERDPASFRYFLKGTYHPFQRSIILDPVNFTRGYRKVEIKDLDLKKQEVEEKHLVWILDYERRAYLKKADRRALENRSLEEF